MVCSYLDGEEVVTDSVSCEEEAVEPEIAGRKYLKVVSVIFTNLLSICSWIVTRALETRVMADSMEVTWA